jgi:O-antigen ligase
MKIFSIYFFLFSFWAENSLGFQLTDIPGLSLFNLSFYLLMIVWAYSVVFKTRIFRSNAVNNWLILLICYVVLTIPIKILIEDIPRISLASELISLKVWVNPFLIFFIIINIIDDEKTCKKSLIGLIVLLIVTAISTPLISLKVIDIGTTYFFYEGRAAGFAEPNQYAGYLVLFIPLILTYVLFEKKLFFKSVSIFLLLIIFIALVTTGSRGGIISFLASMIFYLFTLNRKRMIMLPTLVATIFIVCLIGAISFAVAPSEVTDTVTERLDPTKSESIEEYTAGRLKTWRKGIKLFIQKPIVGHGQRTFTYLLEKQFGMHLAAHNQYLNYLVEFGIIGLSLFIILYYQLFKLILKQQNMITDLWTQKLCIGYVTGLIGYSISMLAVNMSNPRYIFWFYAAIILRYTQLQVKEKQI